MLRITSIPAHAVILLALFVSSADAQQGPGVGYVYPPGGRAGTVVEAHLGGFDWTPDTQFFVLDQRVRLEVLGPPGPMLHPGPPHWFGPKARNKAFAVPREVPVRFNLPADLPPGVIRWQAANANGATTVGEFMVGLEREVLERQARRDGLGALPLVLSGRLTNKEETDQFHFKAARTGLVTCTSQKHRFGFPFHPVLRVHDQNGQLIADAADTAGKGLSLTFATVRGNEYRLTIHDIDYAGNRSLVYRLSLREGPRVVAAIPGGGKPGERKVIRFIGYGIASGKPRLEQIEREVEFPIDRDTQDWQFSLETPFGAAAPFTLALTDVAQLVEPDQPTASGPEMERRPVLQGPVILTGRLATRDEQDQYVMKAKQGDVWSVRVVAQQIGSPLDVAFQIFNARGKQLVAGDDADGTTDAAAEFRVPADGDYRIHVTDLSGTAGRLDAIYHLRVTRLKPAFELRLPDSVEVAIGGQASIVVQVARRGGMQDAIRVSFSGLPEGVTVDGPVEIPAKKNQVKATLQCAASATSLASIASITAVAQNTGVQDTGASNSPFTQSGRVLIAPIMTPRAVVSPRYRDAGRTVHRGATYAAPVVLERLQGYEGEVVLQLAARPDRVRQGIRGQDLVVPPGVTNIEFPLHLPEWVQTDRTSRIILNTVVQIPDPLGNVRYLVNKMDKRITMNVEGALLKVTARRTEFITSPGRTVMIPITVFRSPKLAGDVRLELVGPSSRGLLASPLTLKPDETKATLQVECEQLPESGERHVTIQATVLPRPDLPVISRTRVVFTTRGPTPSRPK